ncbi:hypothetical protein J3F83DRAFT_725166 [Trichoderma novae-zelandiae]
MEHHEALHTDNSYLLLLLLLLKCTSITTSYYKTKKQQEIGRLPLHKDELSPPASVTPNEIPRDKYPANPPTCTKVLRAPCSVNLYSVLHRPKLIHVINRPICPQTTHPTHFDSKSNVLFHPSKKLKEKPLDSPPPTTSTCTR